jgi:23S rRNA U2552 (ribose-2'-O)-methylase RlmE/FtsJ
MNVSQNFATDNPHLQAILNTPGYGKPIFSDTPITRELRILDSKSSKRRRYYERPENQKSAIHWGQRKLLLSEIEFLTDFGNRKEGQIVLYVGAAPGSHILYLSDLFPEYTFVLIDPAGFDEKLYNHPKIIIRQIYFDDQVAKEYQKDNVYFVCDIRTADHTKLTEDENEDYIKRDMDAQMRWHKIMKPIKSMLKFRLPYKPGETSYLDGLVYLPVFGRQSTTETRLVPHDDNMKIWSNTEYEEQLFYFNSVTRMTWYPHSVKNKDMDHCYDCASEIYILEQYLKKYRPDQCDHKLPDMVEQMIIDISREIGVSGRHAITMRKNKPKPTSATEVFDKLYKNVNCQPINIDEALELLSKKDKALLEALPSLQDQDVKYLGASAFALKTTSKDVLPSVSTWMTTSTVDCIPEWSQPFSELRSSLQQTRDKIKNRVVGLWAEHTALLHVTHELTRHMRKKYDAELCTDLWLGYFALYKVFQKHILRNATNFSSLHLSETTGASITALNHLLISIYDNVKTTEYLSDSHIDPAIQARIQKFGNQSKSVTWNWFATLLQCNQNEMSLFKQATSSHWLQGQDDSGLMINPSNIYAYWKAMGNNRVDLAVIDSSIFSHEEITEHERKMLDIKICETICALGVLHLNGSLIIRLFTIFEPATVELLYLLRSSFDSVHVTKPPTSKPTHSEIFVIALGFKGLPNEQLKALLEAVNKNTKLLPFLFDPKDIPKSFTDAVYNLARQFTEAQQQAIEHALEKDGRKDLKYDKSLRSKRYVFEDQYLDELQVVRNSSPVVREEYMDGSHLEMKHHNPYTERQQRGGNYRYKSTQHFNDRSFQKSNRKRKYYDDIEIPDVKRFKYHC